MKSLDRLVYMANQIDKGFAALPHDEAVSKIAAHIKSFWEKRMLAQIFEHLDNGAAGLDERAKQAVTFLKKSNQKTFASLDRACVTATGPE